MRRDFTWTLSTDQGISQVALSGELTEMADFAPLLAELTGDLVLDLAAVRRINSCGLREWLSFIKALRDAGRRFVLERCSVQVVAQLNMISSFLGGANVRSVYAPYYCMRCDGSHQRLIITDETAAEQLRVPFPCPTCGVPMELDDLPDHFLSFMKRTGRSSSSPEEATPKP